MYVIVRTDIPTANQLAQLGHACISAGEAFRQPKEPANIVILQVGSEAALLDAAEHIRDNGIKLVWFEETEYPLGIHALCTEPIDYDSRKVFKKYKLWK